jgi:quercetin dioxygenase-like cupin family protein
VDANPSGRGVVPLSPRLRNDHATYVVAGGNHVRLLLDRQETSAALDVIEVRAEPGGGPPPHRHEFGEWFVVLEGELTMAEERDGVVRCTSALHAGDSVWVPPWAVHSIVNLSAAPTRFLAIGQPGLMTGYFREAGVRVPDERTPPPREPPGPPQVAELSARWGIEFWTGPVDFTALEPS